MRLIIFAIIAAAIAGCVAVDNNSPYAETAAICDNAGLDSRLDEIRDQTRRVRGALAVGTPKGGGAIGVGKTQYDVERRYDNLRDKLNRFDGEVDVGFRNLTSSCKAFSRCMEKNSYEEFKCQQTMNRWDDAEDAFANLSVKLREIEADVAKTAILTKPKKCRGRHCRKPHRCRGDHCYDPCRGERCPPPRRNNSCCDTLNNVFTDCCDRDRERW